MANYKPATESVMAMKDINLTGNITPHAWYEHLRFPSGKPHVNAVIILGEIVFQYRPREILDKDTGKIIGYARKFDGDKLQRNYAAFEAKFGFTKKQSKDAIDFLVSRHLVTKELRNIVSSTGVALNNVLFLDVIPGEIKKINQPSDLQVTPSDLQVIPSPPVSQTNTESIESIESLKHGGDKNSPPVKSPKPGQKPAPVPEAQANQPRPNGVVNPSAAALDNSDTPGDLPSDASTDLNQWFGSRETAERQTGTKVTEREAFALMVGVDPHPLPDNVKDDLIEKAHEKISVAGWRPERDDLRLLIIFLAHTHLYPSGDIKVMRKMWTGPLRDILARVGGDETQFSNIFQEAADRARRNQLTVKTPMSYDAMINTIMGEREAAAYDHSPTWDFGGDDTPEAKAFTPNAKAADAFDEKYQELLRQRRLRK